MRSFLIKNSLFLGIAAVAVVAGGSYWYAVSNRAPAFGSSEASRGNVVESVDVTADVSAENNADLSFQGQGQIAHVYVNEGDAVSAGALLADLDTSALNAGVEQANAAVASAQASLDSTENGTRPEQLAIDESAVTNANASLAAALQSAYAASDDAVRNQIDNLFANVQSASPTFLVPSGDSQILINIQSQRIAMGTALAAWYAALHAGTSDLSPLTDTANATLAQVQAYLNMVAIPVNGGITNSTVTATVLAGYKANVVTARTEVTAAVNALTLAESALTTAQGTLTLAQAGATQQDIEIKQAALLQAQAAAAAAVVALDHASLRAPFAGTVNNLTAKIGQVVSPGIPVASLTNDSGLKVEAHVSETDVAKLKQGDSADVTLDAYGTGTTFPATLTTIDTAPSTVNGVSSYKITLYLKNADARVKDGMTGNVHVIAAEHDNVLAVPSLLVVNNDDSHFVLVSNGGSTERREVQIGISGGGMTEITSGLNEGDRLINF